MADNKRNVTGSYPGAGGAPRPKKNTNPSGSYPGRKKAEAEPVKEVPQPQKTAPPAEKPKKKRFDFKALFSKEILQKYWKTMVYYACILVVSVLLASWICHVGNEVLALIRPDKEITVTIPEKSSVKEIAGAMKEAGIIDHPNIFTLYCKLKKEGDKFQFGEYTINCNLDYNQIIRALKRSAADKTMVSFTVEPGDTQEDLMTTLCDSLGYLEREELEDVLQNYDFSEYSFLKKLPKRNYRLEGYLYPGTYEMYEGESALAVVQRVLDRFQEMVLTEENNKKIKNSKYSLDELITLASILQKEAGGSYAHAAGVYYNRLESEFPYLESQATVAYILPSGHGAVTTADIKTSDPYNTYRNEGLPTGPISNPGADAIAAVLTPEETADQYFATGEDGTTLFAADAAGHQVNLKKAGENARGTGTVS
ncbi:MAG: endolytic transglycosylase MltG [Clostridia bacterium]|nr:endolytic transglycosylase MltG [Clostridia bacterium]